MIDIPKITHIEAAEPFFLRLTYETGERKQFDVSRYISGSWFGELGNYSYFKTVRLIEDGEQIEWPHGQDLAPHELYELSQPIERIPPCP